MSRILIKNGYVVTVNSDRDVFPGVAVVVANRRIESVHSADPASDSKARLALAGAAPDARHRLP